MMNYEITNRIITALQHNFPQFLFLAQMDYDREEIRVYVSNGTGIKKQFVYKYWDLLNIDEYQTAIDEVCDWCRSVLYPKSDPKQIIDKGSYITNCRNCGATLHGSKCEYCGTEYPVNVAYDNKVTINVQGLAFPTVGELCKAISEQQTIRQRLNNYMW